jgi:hypothetical protein
MPSVERPSTMADATAERLRAIFRYVNRFMVAMWRLGLGR